MAEQVLVRKCTSFPQPVTPEYDFTYIVTVVAARLTLFVCLAPRGGGGECSGSFKHTGQESGIGEKPDLFSSASSLVNEFPGDFVETNPGLSNGLCLEPVSLSRPTSQGGQ